MKTKISGRTTRSLLICCLLLAGCATTPPTPPPPSSGATILPTTSASASPAAPSPVGTVPTPRRSLSPNGQYCADYQSILGSGVETQVDDERMDVDRMSRWAGDMIGKYEAASINAPDNLRSSYATVIQFLKDFKVTIDSGDQEAIIGQMRYLPNLNSSMEAIRETSKDLCG